MLLDSYLLSLRYIIKPGEKSIIILLIWVSVYNVLATVINIVGVLTHLIFIKTP